MIITNRKITIVEALKSLCPDAEWSIMGSDYQNIQWLKEEIPKPTIEEINNEIERLQNIENLTEYQRLRAVEYPDFKVYLDGIVKGDQEQIQSYIDACLEVKQKYPKPV